MSDFKDAEVSGEAPGRCEWSVPYGNPGYEGELCVLPKGHDGQHEIGTAPASDGEVSGERRWEEEHAFLPEDFSCREVYDSHLQRIAELEAFIARLLLCCAKGNGPLCPHESEQPHAD
jgi:hypothetical protein